VRAVWRWQRAVARRLGVTVSSSFVTRVGRRGTSPPGIEPSTGISARPRTAANTPFGEGANAFTWVPASGIENLRLVSSSPTTSTAVSTPSRPVANAQPVANLVSAVQSGIDNPFTCCAWAGSSAKSSWNTAPDGVTKRTRSPEPPSARTSTGPAVTSANALAAGDFAKTPLAAPTTSVPPAVTQRRRARVAASMNSCSTT
jgi:hypothetical protein